MPLAKFKQQLDSELDEIFTSGLPKGKEQVVTGVQQAFGNRGPRFFLEGYGDQEFIRMNANSYLGMSMRESVIEAEEEAARKYGVGPGAVRFISGTYEPHVKLERRLAEFHGREDCMITSAAYTSVLGVIVSLTTPETVIVSDELNHNCIINAMKLARPKGKKIFTHLDLVEMEEQIKACVGTCDTVIVVTDGVFSMRGDMAPLKEMQDIIARYSDRFPRDIVFVVDDSHGVGALGHRGRGTEELMGARCDILVATLGKAFGVNGGYVVSDASVIKYLREKNPLYIYTNPITPSEATAAIRAVEILDSKKGRALLEHLSAMTRRFEQGLVDLGFETISSPHPVVPLVVRDTQRTSDMVQYLRENGVLATGLNYPVVPKGDELIRFQIAADHTENDIDEVLGVLKRFDG
jgi:glycine C-acetyltransferase